MLVVYLNQGRRERRGICQINIPTSNKMVGQLVATVVVGGRDHLKGGEGGGRWSITILNTINLQKQFALLLVYVV